MTRPWFVDYLGLEQFLWFVFKGEREHNRLTVNQELIVLFDISPGVRWLARLLRVFGIHFSIRELDFDFIDDVRLPDCPRPMEEIVLHTGCRIIERFERDPQFLEAMQNLAPPTSLESYFRAYALKRLFGEELFSIRGSLLRSVLIVAWYCRNHWPESQSPSRLYVRRACLFPLATEEARRWNVELSSLPGRRVLLRERTRNWIRAFLRKPYYMLKHLISRPIQPKRNAPLRVAAEMYIKGIARNPIFDTEVIWYRRETLPSKAVFGYFAHPEDLALSEQQRILSETGIDWVDRAALRGLLHMPQQGLEEASEANAMCRRPASYHGQSAFQRVLFGYGRDFHQEYMRWKRFLRATGARIHVSSYDIFPDSEALHAAMADLGGVSVSIQRSIERHPMVLRRTVTDVHFAFSRSQAERERCSGSRVRQFITAGYLFEDVFPAARDFGRELACQLCSRGMTWIICFFDENDGLPENRKWIGGAQQTHDDYGFLCKRLADDPTLGLILKPKAPATLRDRLGPVWDELQRFINEGRCILLRGHSSDEHYLPCVAASAADVAVNLVGGATAGLESFLAGTRTLLIRHRANLDVFERLPAESVVFDTWDQLWQAVERLRATPSNPHIGNWEPIVEEFASLRDGCASLRMNCYISWLYEALASGQTREEAMEHAGSRYAAKWGADLITEIAQPSIEQHRVSRDLTEDDARADQKISEGQNQHPPELVPVPTHRND